MADDHRSGAASAPSPTGACIDRAARLVEFRPETGRTHQLRVHSASIGHPILGDPVYGAGKGPMRLHARSLVLPYDEAAPLEVTAPLPQDWPSQALFSAANGATFPARVAD